MSPRATIGRDVTIGAYAVVNDNTWIGDGSFVDAHTLVGAPTAGYYDAAVAYEPAECRIGSGAVIRSHCVVYAGVTIGDDFECGHHVTIREGARIGDGVRIGTSSDVQPEASIGNYARLHSNVFVAKGSTIEELAWLFPYAMLIDDPHPPSDTCTQGPIVRKFAVVGAGSTVFPAVEIGEGAVVGAMSLVRHDVPAAEVVAGVPARSFGAASEVECRHGRLGHVYPWWRHFRRGYPEGVLPDSAGEEPAPGT